MINADFHLSYQTCTSKRDISVRKISKVNIKHGKFWKCIEDLRDTKQLSRVAFYNDSIFDPTK